MSRVPILYPPIRTNESRREVLTSVDEALWSWFHVRVCAVAGVGFFTDAYDLFAINIASFMLHYVYNTSQAADLGLKVSSSVGSLFGQILFGWLADALGRKRIYGVELCLMILGSLAQAVSGRGEAVSLIGVLIMWRFVMGVGVGGDYPSSAVISSEFAPTRTRGRIMTAVFATQGLGNFAASAVACIVVAAFGSSIRGESPNLPHEKSHVDFCWRLIIGLGCVPGAIALYFRLTISETPRFTIDVLQNVNQAMRDVNELIGRDEDAYEVQPDAPIERLQAPNASGRDFFEYFARWNNLRILLGAAYSWFALDVAFYGLGLNSSVVIDTIFKCHSNTSGQDKNPYETLMHIAEGNVIVSVAGLIPGYVLAFCFIDRWGRKPMQLMGFIVSSILFFIMGGLYQSSDSYSVSQPSRSQSLKIAFAVFYCLAELFQNFGPNTTTFIIPGEVFPTRYRSTAYGVCAAAGKTGAIIAQAIFFALDNNKSEDTIQRCESGFQVARFVWVLGGFMATGIFSTLLLPETMGKSLEENSNEDQRFFRPRPNGRHRNTDSVSSI